MEQRRQHAGREHLPIARRALPRSSRPFPSSLWRRHEVHAPRDDPLLLHSDTSSSPTGSHWLCSTAGPRGDPSSPHCGMSMRPSRTHSPCTIAAPLIDKVLGKEVVGGRGREPFSRVPELFRQDETKLIIFLEAPTETRGKHPPNSRYMEARSFSSVIDSTDHTIHWAPPANTTHSNRAPPLDTLFKQLHLRLSAFESDYTKRKTTSDTFLPLQLNLTSR